MKTIFVLASFLTCVFSANAQTTAVPNQAGETAPKFLAADVHHSNPLLAPSMIGPTTRGDIYQVKYARIVDLIGMAYGVERDKVVGGPPWISMYRIDLKAKAPATLTPESTRLMMKSLLMDRFHLVARPGSKPVNGYNLTVGKRPLLKRSDGTGESGCKTAMPPPADGAPADGQLITVTCRNVTMAQLIDVVRDLPRATRAAANPPIVDKTGLSGAWDFEFHYDVLAARGGDNTVFAQAFDQQLGLKLDLVPVAVPVLEVQSMDFDPTPNPPDTAKYFPPPPSEFDVAEVRRSAPPTAGNRQVFEVKNGRVILPGITVGFWIRVAWDLEDTEVVGGPKWMDTDRFDIIAKAPESAHLGVGTGELDFEPLRLMLKNLLVQRFQLKAHTEDRPADAYVLKAVKPKLTPTADPARRAGWHDGPPYVTKDPNLLNPAMGRTITCTNLSMAEFARLLPGMDPSAFNHIVRDGTGIQGTFDFTIQFERYAILAGGRGGTMVFTTNGLGMVGGRAETSDPSGKLSIIQAVSKQLGLKLELEKRPFPVLVIDSIAEKPVEGQ